MLATIHSGDQVDKPPRVGGTPQSFVRAGMLGLPLIVAIIGGETERFRPLIDLYRKSGQEAGFSPDQLKVGLHSPGYVGEDDRSAIADYYPGYAQLWPKLGRERGWPPVTRGQFDSLIGQKVYLLWAGLKRSQKSYSDIAKRRGSRSVYISDG